jgi:hypothetical protein
MNENEISRVSVDGIIEVYRVLLGPGLVIDLGEQLVKGGNHRGVNQQ